MVNCGKGHLRLFLKFWDSVEFFFDICIYWHMTLIALFEHIFVVQCILFSYAKLLYSRFPIFLKRLPIFHLGLFQKLKLFQKKTKMTSAKKKRWKTFLKKKEMEDGKLFWKKKLTDGKLFRKQKWPMEKFLTDGERKKNCKRE